MGALATSTPGADKVVQALGSGYIAAGWLDPADVVSPTSTTTLTNKRVTRRVVALADAATVAINADNLDVGNLTTTQNFTLDDPAGTPTDGQLLEIRIKSASSFTIAYDTLYNATADLALPTATTGGGSWDRLLFEWNDDSSEWDILAKNFGA